MGGEDLFRGRKGEKSTLHKRPHCKNYLLVSEREEKGSMFGRTSGVSPKGGTQKQKRREKKYGQDLRKYQRPSKIVQVRTKTRSRLS